MTAIFLIAGKMFSGKSTLAKSLQVVLEQRFPESQVHIHGFAYGVKDVAYSAFGWDGVKDDKGRRLLQVVGTEAGREYNPNIWAEKAYTYIQNYPSQDIFIFDDWRFPNELEVWNNKPDVEIVYTIRSFRDEQQYSDHASETSLPEDDTYYNYLFDNNIDIDMVRHHAFKMVNNLLGEKI